MKNTLIGVILTLLALFIFKYCQSDKKDVVQVKEHSALIQESLKNVGKLVVTEGHFSQVYNYNNSKEIFGRYFTSEKKALVVVNATVTVAYDLSKMNYKIDETNKKITIKSIPEEEITINPDFEYYDIQADFFNPFEAKDYNTIKETVKTTLMKKIEASNIKTNAKNRLISELSKLYILTNSLGWRLQYNQIPITKINELETINP